MEGLTVQEAMVEVPTAEAVMAAAERVVVDVVATTEGAAQVEEATEVEDRVAATAEVAAARLPAGMAALSAVLVRSEALAVRMAVGMLGGESMEGAAVGVRGEEAMEGVAMGAAAMGAEAMAAAVLAAAMAAEAMAVGKPGKVVPASGGRVARRAARAAKAEARAEEVKEVV